MKLLQGGPAVGFEQPYEMLQACHERVERSLDLLLRLAAHMKAQGADAQARDAARDVLRYFDIAAPLHHEDEERHVLPLLRAQGRADLADRIAAEHGLMHTDYQALRPGLEALRDQGQMPATETWQCFADRYRAHIALEEGEAYPLARAATPADALSGMGGDMAARRRA